MGKSVILIAVSITLATGAGFLASKAIGTSLQGPAKTVTINVGAGATGPAGVQGPAGATGPAGPTGPSGAQACPAGFEPTYVVINHPGGHITLYGCAQ